MDRERYNNVDGNDYNDEKDHNDDKISGDAASFRSSR
jgi:hypothetical protein